MKIKINTDSARIEQALNNAKDVAKEVQTLLDLAEETGATLKAATVHGLLTDVQTHFKNKYFPSAPSKAIAELNGKGDEFNAFVNQFKKVERILKKEGLENAYRLSDGRVFISDKHKTEIESRFTKYLEKDSPQHDLYVATLEFIQAAKKLHAKNNGTGSLPIQIAQVNRAFPMVRVTNAGNIDSLEVNPFFF